jgi:hypothetical protein
MMASSWMGVKWLMASPIGWPNVSGVPFDLEGLAYLVEQDQVGGGPEPTLGPLVGFDPAFPISVSGTAGVTQNGDEARLVLHAGGGLALVEVPFDRRPRVFGRGHAADYFPSLKL